MDGLSTQRPDDSSTGDARQAELDRLAEEFVARERRGEKPSVTEYVRDHPELAEGIEEIFPLLSAMEEARVTRPELETPTRRELGDYRLVREIGRGGMGVVYEAEQKTLDRRVALKILPLRATLDPRFLERFRLEAQAAARLQHPNIVPVIGYGLDDGVHYFTMQYIDGRGLDDVIADARERVADERHRSGRGDASSLGPTWYEDAARIGLQAAEALAHAHAHGVLHRDVKPGNLMLDAEGKVWVTDFGLCKEEGSGDLTQPGDLLGTFRYMAPERFHGASDVRGDIYGVGITLYELLARRPAYEDDDRAALSARIVKEQPARLREHDPRIPPDLERIVHKAMAHDPALRYPTADALAADLRAYLEGRPISARAPSLGYVLRVAIRRHKPLAVTLLAAACILVASSIYYVQRLQLKEADARFRQYVANIAAAETATRDRDVAVAARLLDEAPEEYRNWEWHHLRARLDRSLRSFPRWKWPVREIRHSPDGEHVATSAAGTTRIHADATGVTLIQLDHRTHVQALAWHPDCELLAVGTAFGLEVWSWRSAERIVDEQVGSVWGVRFTPDGKHMAFGTQDGAVRMVDTATRETRFSARTRSAIRAVDVHPGGRLLATATEDAEVSVFDWRSGARLWKAHCGRGGPRSIAFVGDLLAVPSSDGHVELRAVEDGTSVRILGHASAPREVARSRDGTRLFSSDGSSIHIWDPRTGARIVTYANDSSTWCGSFHPSGARLATGSKRGSVLEWFVPEHHDPDRRIAASRNCDTLAWDPAGAFFLTGGPVMRLFDGATRELVRTWTGHRSEVIALRVSPDGRWAASGDYRGEVLVWRLPTGALAHRLAVVPDGQHPGVDLAFSADSAQLFTCGSDGAVCAWDVETGASLRRVVFSDRILTAIAASHDGRRLAVGAYYGDVQILRAGDLRHLRHCAGHESVVTDLAFGPGDGVVASASFDRSVKLWNPESGQLIRTLRSLTSASSGVADALFSVSFLPDGSRIASACADCSAKLWDPETGRLVATLRGDGRGWMHAARFSPDGRRLLTIEAGGLVQAWETEPLRERIRRGVDGRGAEERRRRASQQEHSGTSAQIAYLWDALLAPMPDDEIHREVLLCLARDLSATQRERGARDLEADRLHALAVLRCEDHAALTASRRLARIAAADARPDLRAIDLLVVALAWVHLEDRERARSWMRRVDAHLASHPEVRVQRNVAALAAELHALLGD